MNSIALYVFVSFCAGSAVMVLFTKNVFKAVLYFLLCLLAIAGIYVLSFAEFVAVSQILIYAGGISVIMIFGIMLTSRLSGKPLIADSNNVFPGFLVGAMFFALVAYLTGRYLDFSNIQGDIVTEGQIGAIGLNLMTTHTLPFELAGIVLLVSLVGAAVTTSFLKTRKSS